MHSQLSLDFSSMFICSIKCKHNITLTLVETWHQSHKNNWPHPFLHPQYEFRSYSTVLLVLLLDNRADGGTNMYIWTGLLVTFELTLKTNIYVFCIHYLSSMHSYVDCIVIEALLILLSWMSSLVWWHALISVLSFNVAPPVINVNPQNQRHRDPGVTVVFNVSVSGEPHPTITWSHGNHTLVFFSDSRYEIMLMS